MRLTFTRSAVATLVALSACGDARQKSPATLVAGGETSEFSGGDIAFCPEEGASFTPLDLESEAIAPWAALAAGPHEATLVWTPHFASDGLGGYEEHTRVSLDVTVLAARDVVFGEANLGYEGSGCRGTRQRQIQLRVELGTADGALQGSFEQWVTPAVNQSVPGGRVLATTAKANNSSYPLSDFQSTLKLDVAPLSEVTRELGVQLAFDAEAVRGVLQTWITTREPASESGIGLVRPLSAAFPADGCAPAAPLALDEPIDELGEPARAAYDRIRAAFEQGPLTAIWHDGTTDTRAELEQTEVLLRGGEPTHACRSAQGAQVYAPLSVETADGRVRHTQTIATTLRIDGSEISGSMPLLPARDFERLAGLRGFDLTDIEYAGAFVAGHTDRTGAEIQGTLMPTRWEATEQHVMEPLLDWCAGSGCPLYWCQPGIAWLECP